MKVRALGALLLTIVLLTVPANVTTATGEHIRANLQPVGGSGVTGIVNVVGLTEGTRITVVAMGLKPGNDYVSLYYDNHTCELEPYEEDDVIGEDAYTANMGGIGVVTATVEDDLDEINSVSVRLASDFTLLACADIHPEAE